MRTTITRDDDLVARAQELTGRSEVSAIGRMSMELLVQLESGRRLAQLGGTDPDATVHANTVDDVPTVFVAEQNDPNPCVG